MKLLTLFLIAAALSGCVTDTNPDGTTTTRWDAAATKDVIETGFTTYDRYRQYQQPAPQQPLYYNGQVVQPVYR